MGDDAARGVTAYVLRLGRPLYMDLATFKALVASGELEQIGPVEPDSTWLGAPLLSEGRVMGLIAVQTYTADHRYDQADLDVLAFVGRHIGAALTRVRAREEIHARNAELTLVNEIGQALSRELDFDAIIDLVGERIATMFDARTMYIAMYDEAAGRIDFPFELVEGERRHEGPMVHGDGMTSVVIDRRRPLRHEQSGGDGAERYGPYRARRRVVARRADPRGRACPRGDRARDARAECLYRSR